MKVILFLGAGVSVPSGLPTAEQLTALLYLGAHHQASHIHLNPGKPFEPDATRRIRRLFRLLRNHDRRDIRRVGYSPSTKSSSGAIFRGTTTYEDLFYLCDQMRYWSDGRADNSLVTPFMEAIARKAHGLLAGSSMIARVSDLGLLAEKACHFIESVVAGALRRTNPTGFDLILELVDSPNVEQLNIISLNHDTLVEQFLTEKGINFVDGFGKSDGDVRWYDYDAYDMNRARVKLIKLHGSVNWYSFVVGGRMRHVAFLGDDVGYIRDGTGKELKLEYRMPSLLSGMNKAVSYQRGIYSDIHFRFHQALRECEVMVMSGYGWGDAAINWRLDAWLDQRPSNSLTLLHRTPEELSNRSAIIAAGYDPWIRRGQLFPIRKWLCETALKDLTSNFLPGTH